MPTTRANFFRATLRPQSWAAGLLAACLIAPAPVLAADVEKGKQLAVVCATCHPMAAPGSPAATPALPMVPAASQGPSLLGIVGRPAGSVRGFRYSRAVKNAKVVWDAATLDAFLAAPQEFLPGNVMPFGGLLLPEQRADVVEYLKTLRAQDTAPK